MCKIIILLLAALPTLFLPHLVYAGYALEFDGNNDYVSLDNEAMNGISDCTVEHWTFIIREDQSASIFSCARSQPENNEYLHYYEFGPGFRPHVRNQAPGEGAELPLEEWFHLAVTRNGDSGRWIAYLNGEEVDTGILPAGELVVPEGGIVLGQDQDDVGGRFDIGQALLGMGQDDAAPPDADNQKRLH